MLATSVPDAHENYQLGTVKAIRKSRCRVINKTILAISKIYYERSLS